MKNNSTFASEFPLSGLIENFNILVENGEIFKSSMQSFKNIFIMVYKNTDYIEIEKYDSVKGICEYFAGCYRVYLYQLRKRGLLSHNIGGSLGFCRKEVDQWIATQK